MDYEVVVVGGGIGGLTTAALLAARGVNVCVFERQSYVGGCVATFEHQGFSFEPAAGLYSGWESGGTYERIFSQLAAKPPEVRRVSPPYVVRLPDGLDVAISEDGGQFTETLSQSFPECAEAAISFYQQLFMENKAWRDAKNLSANSSGKQSRQVSGVKEQFVEWNNQTTQKHLTGTSHRFQRFIDVQLQTFTQTASNECSYLQAAIALGAAHRALWTIRGGAQSLADSLATCIKESGGSLRLNSPVLRLAYGSDGMPIGVDLLTGEQVRATRAIISNLTIWDTYGKLIGLSHTPAAISAQLRKQTAWGAYLLFLGMDEAAAARLSADRILMLTDWEKDGAYAAERTQLLFAAAPAWDPRAPAGQRAVTVLTFTDAQDWFAFHEDDSAHERQDQAQLESCWTRLHSALPELRDGVEIIETATPQTFYENTRRKFGMIGRPSPRTSCFASGEVGATAFPNVFLVGDTVAVASGLESVCEGALEVANTITSR